MAKDGDEALMSTGEMKPLLRLCRRRPISCAVCMTAHGEGVLLLHRRMRPRRLLAELRRKSKAVALNINVASLRFGRATVDGSSDSMKVTFTVNKLSPGPMRRALLLKLRPAGYQRCEIVVDDGLEEEAEDEGEELEGELEDDVEELEEEGEPVGVAGVGGAAEGGVGAKADHAGAGDAKAGDAKAGDAKAGDGTEGKRDEAHEVVVDRLRSRLIALVKELVAAMGHDPGRRKMLLELVNEGHAALKAGDVRTAFNRIEALTVAVHAEGVSRGGPGGRG